MFFSFWFADFTEIMKHGKWRELKEVAEEKGLESLSCDAQKLVMESHAASTVKGYTAAFNRWWKWAEEYEFVPIPAAPVSVTLYLMHLLERCDTVSPVNTAVAAIAWAHKKACEASPVDDMVKQVLEAARRRLAQPKNRKEPLKKQEVARIVEKLTETEDCLKLRTAVFIAVGFAGFMRWNDMENIKVEDMTFHSDHMEIRLKKRKNDQFRRGSVILISRHSSTTGPVGLCEQLIAKAQLKADSCLLSNLVHTERGWIPRKGSLQYSRARELMKEALAAAGLEECKYGLHSLRSGGTTAAAAEKVPERLLRRHGGWRSDAINCYVEETLENLLKPSKAASWN